MEIGENSGFIQTFFFGQLTAYPGAANGFISHGSLPVDMFNTVQGDYNWTDGANDELRQTCFIGYKSFLNDDHVGHLLDTAGAWNRIALTNNVAEDDGDKEVYFFHTNFEL